jgi:chromosome segregation ATPase
MDLPWWVTVAAAGVVIAGAVSFEAHVYSKGADAGRAEITAQWQQATLKAKTQQDAERAKLQKEKDDALQQAADREKSLRADADRVRGQRDSLQRELAASRAAIDTASLGSLRARVAALTDVFEECVREYSDVAAKADGHASDSLMYQHAWPTK